MYSQPLCEVLVLLNLHWWFARHHHTKLFTEALFNIQIVALPLFSLKIGYWRKASSCFMGACIRCLHIVLTPFYAYYLLFFPLEFLSLIHWCFSMYFLFIRLEICRLNMLVTQRYLYKQWIYWNVKSAAICTLTPNLSPYFVCLFVFNKVESW